MTSNRDVATNFLKLFFQSWPATSPPLYTWAQLVGFYAADELNTLGGIARNLSQDQWRRVYKTAQTKYGKRIVSRAEWVSLLMDETRFISTGKVLSDSAAELGNAAFEFSTETIKTVGRYMLFGIVVYVAYKSGALEKAGELLKKAAAKAADALAEGVKAGGKAIGK